MGKKAKWRSFSEAEIRKIFEESLFLYEVSEKLGYPKSGSSYFTIKTIANDMKIDMSHFYCNVKKYKKGYIAYKTKIEDYFNNKVKITSHKLRLRLLDEGYFQHKCQSCGLEQWLGQPMPLELHHKDGNKNNNELNNLDILCPNCHVFTDTYKIKNIT